MGNTIRRNSSALSAQLLNKLSTLTASFAASPSSMATQQQVASAQSLQASLVKLQELNTCNDLPIIRNARSEQESRQLRDEFSRAIQGLQDGDSVMTVVLKWATSNSGPMNWGHHHEDIAYFSSHSASFRELLQTSLSTSLTGKYLVISEAEWSNLKNYGWLRSPRFSDDESTSPSTSAIVTFSSLSDAINHYVYVKVAHSLCSLH